MARFEADREWNAALIRKTLGPLLRRFRKARVCGGIGAIQPSVLDPDAQVLSEGEARR